MKIRIGMRIRDTGRNRRAYSELGTNIITPQQPLDSATLVISSTRTSPPSERLDPVNGPRLLRLDELWNKVP